MFRSLQWRIAWPFILVIVVNAGLLGAARASVAVIAASISAGMLAILAAGLIARSTNRAIKELTRASRGIAAGELEQKIRTRARDETGRLAQAFNEMSARLRNLVGEISAESTKLQTVLANMTDGVIMADQEGLIVLANQATERLFNFRQQDAVNKPLIEALRDHEVDELLKLCLKTRQAHAVHFESHLTRRFLRTIAVPIVEGKLTGVLLLFQDLTELRSLQTTRRELVGNISHELRTPIAGIKAMVETLKDGAIDDREAATDFLGRIDSEVDHLTQMVSELTELSRIESGRAKLTISQTNLNPLIEEVVARMKPLAERQHLTIAADLAADLPAVASDGERIRQTVINLVHNAIKFSYPGGGITLSTRSDGESVIVSISDTGIGISGEDLPHIFERFYKADKARTKGGSGLGLAIAKHTIQANGGNIWAKSEEGKGSTFSFSLPIKANPGAPNL